MGTAQERCMAKPIYTALLIFWHNPAQLTNIVGRLFITEIAMKLIISVAKLAICVNITTDAAQEMGQNIAVL